MRKFLLLMCGLALFTMQVLAQSRTVSGKITNEQGVPIPNASVIIKGTTVGTTTNADGAFSLSVPANVQSLVISSIGYSDREFSIRNQSTITVSLNNNQQSMNEVVVVAYGTVKREALTGSVGTIKASDIQKRPVSNVTQTIEGAVPGVITTTGSGQPGSGIDIRIRGFGSINASSDPLYVVDGVPYVGGTSNINPDDVENITILKDASSTALYGSRAANGVVMITTKKGRKGRNNITVRAAQGFATRGLPEYERVNAFQYYPVMWEAYRNSLVYPLSGTGISLDSANRVASGRTSRTGIAELLAYNPFNVAANQIVDINGNINPNAQLIYGDDLDWNRELMRRGNRSDYNVNFNGGADKIDYFLSLGYLNQAGYTKKTDFERYSARLNVNVQPLSWIKTGLNISGNFSKSNFANEAGAIANPFTFSRNIGPIYPFYAHNMTTGAYLLDEKGNRIWDLGNFGGTPLGTANGISNRPGTTAGRHATAEILLNEDSYRRTFAGARSTTDIMFLRYFKFTNNVAVDIQNQSNISYENTLVGDGAPGGRSSRSTGTNTGFTANQLLNFNKGFGSHHLDVLVGHESYNQYLSDLDGFKQGQSLTGNSELGNFTTINSLSSSVDRYRIESYFSRVSYDYQNRYYLTGSLRRDGNSRFSSDARWGTFWSVGAGWNLDREKFMENVNWVNTLKLRSSYGVVGVADGIGFYAYQGLYVFANNANEPGIVQSQTAFLNRNLTWEKNNQFDIGVDFGLFKNRLTGTVEYFNRVSADLLFAVPQPLSSGALSTQQNTATMYNRGIELQLNGDVVRNRNFVYNIGVNLSTVKNEITKMPPTVPTFISGTKKYEVGSSIFDYWLRTYYGVDPNDGAVLYKAENTAASSDVRYIKNNQGATDTVTTTVANAKFEYNGSVIPDFYGSLTQSITFKGFTLTGLFTFQKGGLTYDANYQTLMSVGAYGSAKHVDILNRWQKPGDVANVPRMDAGRTVDFNATSSRWLVDASYLNIRNLNLSYNLPTKWLKKIHSTSTQLYVSVENVAFFSKRKGMNNQNAFSGITGGGYPPARVFLAGLIFNL